MHNFPNGHVLFVGDPEDTFDFFLKLALVAHLIDLLLSFLGGIGKSFFYIGLNP